MKIKFCGITRQQDALQAVALGVDAIGFIFYNKSPRYVSPEVVADIVRHIPSNVMTVGVFVDEDLSVVQDIISTCGLRVVQLHGDESPEYCRSFHIPVFKAIRVAEEADIQTIASYRDCVAAVLLDTKVAGIPGGTGKVFDWSLAVKAKAFGVPIILSGGLTVDNIEEAIRTVQPYAVDVSSGIEASPGIKDEAKMRLLRSVIG